MGSPVRVTVAEFVDRWTTEPKFQRPAESTNVFNRERIRFLRQAYGRRRLSRLTAKDARVFEEAHGPHAKKVAAAMLEDALRDSVDGLERNVFRDARSDRNEQPPRIPTNEELDSLLVGAQEAISGDYGTYFASVVELAAFSGLGPGELLALRWADVDWQQGELHVIHAFRGKTLTRVEYPRTTVLLPRAAEALRRMQRLSPKPKEDAEPFVCLTRQGRRFTDETLKYWFRPVREKAGLEIAFKDLRHFFAKLLADTGKLTPADVAEQLGHRDGGRVVRRNYFGGVVLDTNERIRQLFS